MLDLTSLSHQESAHILRRLDLDEYLNESDFRRPARRYVHGLDDVSAPAESATTDFSVGSVDTPTVATNALTKNAYFDPTHGSESIGVGAEVSLCSVTVATDGGHVKILFKATLASFVDTPDLIAFKLYKGNLGGTLLDETVEVAALHSATLLARDTSPAASQSYTVGAQISGSGNDAVVVDNIRLFAENTKATS
jgi:hypothetical protein